MMKLSERIEQAAEKALHFSDHQRANEAYLWAEKVRELEEKEKNHIDCLDRIQNMCIGDVAMGVNIDSGAIGKLVWEAVGKITPSELSDYNRKLKGPTK